jgi:hypothetical protein
MKHASQAVVHGRGILNSRLMIFMIPVCDAANAAADLQYDAAL